MNWPTWDILMTTIPHRHERMCELLAELDRQISLDLDRRVHVRVFRDNLEHSYGDKCQKLVESSAADYVSFLDDDDWIDPAFIHDILHALDAKPDYVGFKVRYTLDGVRQMPVEHSLRYKSWENLPDILIRDIVHFNPIRRELALLGQWEGGNGADRRWSDGVRSSGRCKREVWIPREMHHYRNRSGDTFLTPKTPMPSDGIGRMPEYPWLVDIGS